MPVDLTLSSATQQLLQHGRFSFENVEEGSNYKKVTFLGAISDLIWWVELKAKTIIIQ